MMIFNFLSYRIIASLCEMAKRGEAFSGKVLAAKPRTTPTNGTDSMRRTETESKNRIRRTAN